MRSRTLLALSGLLFLAGFVLAALLFLRSGGASAGTTVVDAPALLRQVRQLNELATVKYTIQKVVGLEEQKKPFGSEKLLLIVQAKVIGGVDLAGMTPGDVVVLAHNEVIVKLPPARVLHAVIDEKETRVWDRQITWWTPWVPYSPDLERKARMAAVESVNEAAVAMGILQDADRNARSSIRGLLQAAGITQVRFAARS